MNKFILMALMFPSYALASDLNLNVSKDVDTKSSYVNIITVDDTTFDQNGVSQTLVMFTDNGNVYYTIQSGRSCNFKSGKTSISISQKDVILTPNSSCNQNNQIIENW